MPKTDTNPELDDLAFRLYVDRISKMPANANGTEVSRWAYAKAQEFAAVRQLVQSGDPGAIARKSRLADCATPNCKPNHPFNLVSQRYSEENGGEDAVLKLVERIVSWLNAHPRNDQAPIALDQLDRHTRLDWDATTTNLARVVLPEYCHN